MPRESGLRDNVGPSRDGHEFHEAWAARKAMQLLLPQDGLIGIAVEGLSEADEAQASQETADVADLTVYYGDDANFQVADHVEVLQFKYAPTRPDKEFRASDAKKTIEKFAESYSDYRKNYGASAVTRKLTFELISNRPVFSPLTKAIDGIASGARLTGDALKQSKQFKRAAGLSGDELIEFASKCRITGMAGTLKGTKSDLWKIVVDWSASTDATARARLGDLRDMVRRKAGYEEDHRKVIRQVDVLDALSLADVEELLPCPASLAEVGDVVERDQLLEAVSLIPSLTQPLLIHAEGGFGKTVFLRSLASKLSEKHEVVFFDCFGGGAYRSPEDGRHKANRGLVHITNLLACNGLCDPILPGSENLALLIRTFRRRVEQCVKAMASASSDRQLILFIDAIDNAALHARDCRQAAFPSQLIESLQYSGPIPGVKLVVSARTHRIPIALGDLDYRDFALSPFTPREAGEYLRNRLPDITETEIAVAHARSEGNARILEHLVASDRALLTQAGEGSPLDLDELLQERIDGALAEALERGYPKSEIAAFLAGLSVLPPPIPLEEYAGAYGMEVGAIESFAADLAPLLDRTQQGMIFRDEPTETLVRKTYETDSKSLRRVARNLFDRQDKSVYAARALPNLLQKLGERKKLFKLAFDERFPPSISGTVGRRRVRYARLQAACLQFANDVDWNGLVQLLVELSGVTAGDQRGSDYILSHPDLVINARDTDALRRLFETRTKWAGGSHARLTIANLLSGEMEEASRCFSKALAWIRHDLELDQDDDGRARPERLDRVAIPLFRIIQGQPERAIAFMRYWHHWYGFELTEHLFALLRLRIARDPKQGKCVERFVDGLTTEVDCLAGTLSFLELSEAKRRIALEKLARACKRSGELPTSGRISNKRPYELPDGLRKAAAGAVSLGMKSEALKISLRAPHKRPSLWEFVDYWEDRGVFPFLFRIALKAAVNGTDIVERDLLPTDLLPFAKGLARSMPRKELARAIERRIEFRRKRIRRGKKRSEELSADLEKNTKHFLSHRLEPLLVLTRALASLLGAPPRRADKPFKELMEVWGSTRRRNENRYYDEQFNRFFQSLGQKAVFFALWARSDLKTASVRVLCRLLEQQDYTSPQTLTRLVAILSRNGRSNTIVMKKAAEVRSLIAGEQDVDVRAKLYADLARALLTINGKEAEELFKVGLDQLDSIGSGDYGFTNELLGLASALKGDELAERDFHTLTNICELNMSYDETRFPWGAFGAAMSKTAGLKGLAKIARWHDREKISLGYTLLPYLAALLKDGKISGSYALALNRLAEPVELWGSDTEVFAKILEDRREENEKELFAELLKQYLANEPGVGRPDTTKTLARHACRVLGRGNQTSKYLVAAHKQFRLLRQEQSRRKLDSPVSDARLYRAAIDEAEKSTTLRELARATNPLDANSLEDVFSSFPALAQRREREREFFGVLRRRLAIGDRVTYLDQIAHSEQLDRYSKVQELESCKQKWANTSLSISSKIRALSQPLVTIHAEDYLDNDSLSVYRLKEVADLTETPMPELVLELIKIFVERGWAVPAAAWVSLSNIICPLTDEGYGQKALSRLLNSDAANLTKTVQDGPWQRGCYPGAPPVAAAAGLVWQMLGAPRASDRWLAAHSLCAFARLQCWEVVDAVVGRIMSRKSRSFQAPELKFYYLHARLWLLIALARIALDSPAHLAKHANVLKAIANSTRCPQVLIRHFAAQTILQCERAGVLTLKQAERNRLVSINGSRLAIDTSPDVYDDFYRPRPDDIPEPQDQFSLDYDFDKYEVQYLANKFAVSRWRVKDLIAEAAHELDPGVTRMHDKGGREIRTGHRNLGISSSMHGYGHYVGWQALYIAAGKLLTRCSLSDDSGTDEAWREWVASNTLARSDGYWLSDGMDYQPVDSMINVLESVRGRSALTGSRAKLLSLAGIEGRKLDDEIVVAGRWKSPDNINVRIDSALVSSWEARARVRELLDESPLSVWLPTLNHDNDDEVRFGDAKPGFEPWIVTPSIEGHHLDEYDPLSVIEVERRPFFAAKIVEMFDLRVGDPFRRSWRLPRNRLAARAEAWGYEMPYEESATPGNRLLCRPDFLKTVLVKRDVDLLLLIRLHRYESDRYGSTKSRFSNTVVVLRIKKNLKFEYFKGAINQIHSGF